MAIKVLRAVKHRVFGEQRACWAVLALVVVAVFATAFHIKYLHVYYLTEADNIVGIAIWQSDAKSEPLTPQRGSNSGGATLADVTSDLGVVYGTLALANFKVCPPHNNNITSAETNNKTSSQHGASDRPTAGLAATDAVATAAKSQRSSQHKTAAGSTSRQQSQGAAKAATRRLISRSNAASGISSGSPGCEVHSAHIHVWARVQRVYKPSTLPPTVSSGVNASQNQSAFKDHQARPGPLVRYLRLQGFMFVDDPSMPSHIYDHWSQPPYLKLWQPQVWAYLGAADFTSPPLPVTVMAEHSRSMPHRPIHFESDFPTHKDCMLVRRSALGFGRGCLAILPRCTSPAHVNGVS